MIDSDWEFAQHIAEDEATIQALILVHYGVPFDVAFSLDEVKRFAWVCVYKMMYENVVMDWTTKRWKERPQPKTWGKI